ncbi:1-(5-phosphoribosyl)-5-[(5-phosphoribosylamino)methylideneamino]imidazole-4-carboxamide isomerase [Sporolactobacillus pectinivorans]|uniref:1-(5-phosphoribosyl)-5-[(5- phosphoribosylamino)methylideneamino]imidazole-4- carboxamide isomerase n=1 Tax=Sporolactobacillus pectinivorans TaxID=1591408 RepID=UPI000C26A4BF|nr:1-(5-phosphoribosyl)-5-[(5-phosphoribosylamino)methylideneamino]imidazole-4-carboxamide isomerase [Sporolactobacillus pectinivorans]
MFTIYPAIDLLGGKCVRLYQGDYGQSTVYDASPVSVAQSFYDQGAEWLHVVDLDGAKAGHPVNQQIIRNIASEVPIRVEVGGGIRSLETVKFYLDGGVRRVVLGSSAIADPEFTREALRKYPDEVTIGLDVKNGKVAVKGWLEVSDLSATELARELIRAGACRFIYTDISRDGALQGANVAGAEKLAAEIGIPVVLSGGVTTIKELEKMAGNASGGISGAIIGKALYTKQILLREAVRAVKTVAGKTNYPLS